MEEEIGTPNVKCYNVKIRDTFLTGVVFALLTLMLIQDFIGKEAYIELINKHWVEATAWWFWLFPAILFLVQYGYDLYYNRLVQKHIDALNWRGNGFPQHPWDGQLYIYRNHLYTFDKEKTTWINLGELNADKLVDE